jgi:hypothetical protein
MSNVVSHNIEYNFYVIENMHNMKNQLPSAMLFEPYAIGPKYIKSLGKVIHPQYYYGQTQPTFKVLMKLNCEKTI